MLFVIVFYDIRAGLRQLQFFAKGKLRIWSLFTLLLLLSSCYTGTPTILQLIKTIIVSIHCIKILPIHLIVISFELILS